MRTLGGKLVTGVGSCFRLDLDHRGGLRDFPRTRVHLAAEELSAATRPGKSGIGGVIRVAA
ncbi:hypothetical protein ACRAKI_02680 [Saccharothrix isguenensis]